MNATAELFQLADAAGEAVARCQDVTIQEPLKALQRVCGEVGRAWSGSNIGYHATVYYAGLQPKPPYVQFSAEWGLMDRWPTHQPDPGWQMMDSKEVTDYIVAQIGQEALRKTNQALDFIRKDFGNFKETAISILSAVLSNISDSFLQRQLTVIEELGPDSPQKIARQFISGRGQYVSRDMTAMTQGLVVAPHQSLLAIPLSAKELEAALDNLEKAARLSAAHVARLDERQPTVSAQKGTTICIGHGKSSLWRELKDFLEPLGDDTAAIWIPKLRLADFMENAKGNV